jgi:hypothetical protein
MTHREKVDAALAYLKTRKISGSSAAPPFFRLCWALGIKIPPPHFLSFPATVLVLGVPFGLLMATALAVVALIGSLQVAPWLLLGLPGLALMSGGAFGLLMAAYYRWTARNLNLPSWSDFGKYEADHDADW